MTLEVPIDEFLCAICRNSERAALWHLPSPYIRFDVAVPQSDGAVAVAVEIENIVWKRLDTGVYNAVARMKIVCPCCESVREIQRQVRACRIVVADSAVCGKCGGSLRLDQDEIEYSGESADNPVVTIRANLMCSACSTTRETNSATVAVGATMRQGSDIEVTLDNFGFRPMPGER